MIAAIEIREIIIRAMEGWRPRATGSFALSADGQYITADSACWGVQVEGSVVLLTPVDIQTREVHGRQFPIPIPPAPAPPPPESPLAQVVALGHRCQTMLEVGQKSFGTWQRHTSGVRDGTAVVTDHNLLVAISETIAAHQQSTEIAEAAPKLVGETLAAVHVMREYLTTAERGRRNFSVAGEWQEAPTDQQRLDQAERQAHKLQKALDEAFRPALPELTEKTPLLITAALRELRDRACIRYTAESTRARQRLQAEREAIEREEGDGLKAIQGFDAALAASAPTIQWSANPLEPPDLR